MYQLIYVVDNNFFHLMSIYSFHWLTTYSYNKYKVDKLEKSTMFRTTRCKSLPCCGVQIKAHYLDVGMLHHIMFVV